MTREYAEKRLKMIIAASAKNEKMWINVNELENYGKSRTYLTIVNGKKQKRYGYIDNMTGEYFPEKYGDLEKNFTFEGSDFEEPVESVEETTETVEETAKREIAEAKIKANTKARAEAIIKNIEKVMESDKIEHPERAWLNDKILANIKNTEAINVVTDFRNFDFNVRCWSDYPEKMPGLYVNLVKTIVSADRDGRNYRGL